MKKILKWIYANKISVSAIVSLLLFFLDEIFKCIGFHQLPEGLYYVIISVLFTVIGYAVKGKGFVTIEEFEKIIQNKEKLKTGKSFKHFLLIIINLLFRKETKEIIEEDKQEEQNEKTAESVEKVQDKDSP